MQPPEATPDPRKRRLPRPTDSRDEMNIAEFPIALLTDRAPTGLTTLEFHDSIQDPGTGAMVQRKLTVTATEKFGLPTAADDEVILGLIQLTKFKNDFTDRTVNFSRYELVRLLGWRETGPSYRRLEESFDRWMSVYLSYERAWWDNKRKGWMDEKFHILERVSLFERNREPGGAGQHSLPFSSFTWNEVVFQSFQNGYLKGLDLDFYLALQSPTAKRMYRFLDKHFYRRPRLEYDLHDFAFEHIGLSRVYRTGVLKQKLAPAVAELEAKGFLEPLAAGDRYRQVRRGEWTVVFQKKQPAVEVKPAKGGPGGLEKELVDRGVTPATAAELAAAFPPERIAAKVEVFDWLSETKDARLSKSPTGYLVDSIRKDYQPPQGFESKAERDRKQKAAAQRRQALEEKRRQQEEAQREKERQEEAARRAKRAHIDGHLSGLTAQEQEALQKRAFESAETHMRPYLRKEGTIGDVMRQQAIDAEVLRVRPLPQAAPER